MSDFENTNDTFLADWLAGNLSDEQLRELVSATDFEAYQTLRNSLDSYAVSSPDMAQNYAAVKAKRIIANTPKQSKAIPLYRYFTVAAAVALIFGLYQLFAFSNTVGTGFGKTAAITLNDDSHVTLNAKSQLSYPTLFKFNRTLKLNGEAFFEVEKGSAFTVETSQGEIQVLGTKFNVISRPDFFEVVCFEGKVKVSSNAKSAILVPGDAIRFCKNQPEMWVENNFVQPLWLTGESAFRNVPLQYVINQLQLQYNYKVSYPEAYKNLRFTGSFTNTNLATALQSVCIPMNLKFTKTDSRKIIISE